MKIYNNNKVYVQVSDLKQLIEYEKNVPHTIFEKLIKITKENNDDNNFIVFDKPNELEYFKLMRWIVDYKRVRNLSNEDLKRMSSRLTVKMNEALLDGNDKQFQLADYKIKQLEYLMDYRNNKITIPFPDEIDEDGFTFNSDYTYTIKGTLDPTKILLFRKDGEVLKDDEEIPREFIQTGLSIAMMQNTRNNYLIGDYSIEHKLSDDKKYLVTKMNFVPYKDKEIEKPKSFFKKIKNMFKNDN